MPQTHAAIDIGADLVLRDDRPGIATLTLNRPASFNALSDELLGALEMRLAELAADDAVRVVVIAGSGKAFCAGHDLKQMRSRPDPDYYRELFARSGRVMHSIIALPQPVIARVHGIATAAGCQLVATCDLAVASAAARFAVSGITIGLFCSTPGVALSRNLSRKRAMEMLLTGDFIDAGTAADYGLVNSVVEPERLDEAVYALAARIAARPGRVVRLGKELFYRQIETNLNAAYGMAVETMACNMMLAEAAEGIDAFIEKRAPDWPPPER